MATLTACHKKSDRADNSGDQQPPAFKLDWVYYCTEHYTCHLG